MTKNKPPELITKAVEMQRTILDIAPVIIAKLSELTKLVKRDPYKHADSISKLAFDITWSAMELKGAVSRWYKAYERWQNELKLGPKLSALVRELKDRGWRISEDDVTMTYDRTGYILRLYTFGVSLSELEKLKRDIEESGVGLQVDKIEVEAVHTPLGIRTEITAFLSPKDD